MARESLTKNRQSEDTIGKMVDNIFSPLKMKHYKELTEGYFNVAYEVELSDGKVAILKIAPTKDIRIMTHEKNIMSSEVQAMRTVAQSVTIPVPQIYGYDDSCTLCDSPYFFMEKLKGSSLDTIKDTLTQEQIENIYIETGKIICAVLKLTMQKRVASECEYRQYETMDMYHWSTDILVRQFSNI